MFFIDTTLLIEQLSYFARGGGGGSSGGGDGDGGVIVFLGYLPTHFVGRFFRKRLKNSLGLTLTSLFTILYAGLWLFMGGFGFFVALAALVGGPAGYFGWFSVLGNYLKKSKKAKAIMTSAHANDPTWDEAAITAYVKNMFVRFQSDWASFNTESMRTYVAQPYMYHLELMLFGLKLRQRRNDMQKVEIIEVFPVDAVDSIDNTQDRISYYIEASAEDSIIETINGTEKKLFTDKNTFSEVWNLQRSGNNWLLSSITQTTANVRSGQAAIKLFAEQNGLFYSLDWGWLLLPRQGNIFKKGSFGKSDINNHVIGVYNNLLIELYTYLDTPQAKEYTTYTIAQVALPKRYGSIIVEAKKGWSENIFRRKPKGYNKISMEWPDFNKRYRVYATNVEQITAFELLHPAYMEKLFALPFKVSIEVVDNVVYLYTTDKKADYPTMLNILKDAFKEMRL